MQLTNEERSKYKSFEFILIDKIIENGGFLTKKSYEKLVRKYCLVSPSSALEYFINTDTVVLNDRGYDISLTIGSKAIINFLSANYGKLYNDFCKEMSNKDCESFVKQYLVFKFKKMLLDIKQNDCFFKINKYDIDSKISTIFDKRECLNMDVKQNKSDTIEFSEKDKMRYLSFKIVLNEALYKNANKLSVEEINKIIDDLGYDDCRAKLFYLLKNDSNFIRTVKDMSVDFSMTLDNFFEITKSYFKKEYDSFSESMNKKGYSIDVINIYIKNRLKRILEIISTYNNKMDLSEKIKSNIFCIFSENDRFLIEAPLIDKKFKEENMGIQRVRNSRLQQLKK